MRPAFPIRPATAEDAPAISALVLSVAHFFTLDPKGLGAEDFLRTLEPDAVAARLSAASFATWVAVADGDGATGATGADGTNGATGSAMADVVVVRGGSHLFHLFVAEPFQGQGVARRLWLHALSHLAPGTRTTVNATPFAQGFYERMGFVATGPTVQTRGIAFVPMVRESGPA